MLSEIKKYPNWVAYRLDWSEKKGKFEKRPVNPMTGDFARANDSATWGSYDDAAAAVEKFGANGVGFEFSSPFAGIDLDNCIDDNGNLKDWAADVIRTMDSYTEFSPSGHGLHILFKGEILKEFTDLGKQGTKVGDIELYYGRRFFTVTERSYGEVKPIQERTEQAHEVYLKYMRKKTEPHNPVSDESDTYLTDSEILEKMFNSLTRGEKFRRLYGGDISDYPSHSEADMALCRELAFYTRKDATQIDRIFRGSGLMSDKWDRPTAGSTYGAITIDKAIASTHDNYGRSERTQEKKREEKQGAESEKIENHTLADYLQNSLISDFVSFREYSERKTGFNNLDKDIFIMPGLYLIGAVSGAGKTTFCTQLADNLASKGELVLFFSFEMSEFELATKGLSRLMYKNAVDYMGHKEGRTDWSVNEVLTAVEIRRGKSKEHSDKEVFELIERARAEYSQMAANEIIIQCDFETGMDEVLKTVEKYADRKPVVFIDYLQAISKTDKKQPTREVIDDTVKALKSITRDCHVPVFLISSFNRENYLNVVDLTSFKESGGIEYTADFVAGLQLRAMNASIFNSDKNLQIKREFIRQEQMRMPRELELVVLKSRFNSPGAKYYFDYYAPYDYFQACGKKRDEIRTEINERAEIFKTEYDEKTEKEKAKKKVERR